MDEPGRADAGLTGHGVPSTLAAWNPSIRTRLTAFAGICAVRKDLVAVEVTRLTLNDSLGAPSAFRSDGVSSPRLLRFRSLEFGIRPSPFRFPARATGTPSSSGNSTAASTAPPNTSPMPTPLRIAYPGAIVPY